MVTELERGEYRRLKGLEEFPPPPKSWRMSHVLDLKVFVIGFAMTVIAASVGLAALDLLK